jgi:hypothetical protein
MPTGLVVKVNDFGFDLTFTVLNADGTPRDLTTINVKLYVYTQDQDPTLLFSGICTVSIPAAGVCTYTVTPTNFSEVGTFNAELEMTQSTVPFTPPYTFLEDTETFSINVIPRHPVP